tara:strand:- start:301 stop:738 length:438 start_codon:yes stop_codon:yes gene_type:complete
MKKAVLLINLGTPDSPTVPAVGKYLKEFLNDSRVIDFPYLKRKLLVNGIIVPFRKRSSTKIYKELWTEKGSPLLYHLVDLAKQGAKNLLVFSSVFVADCLETTIEIGSEFEELSIENGGEKLQLVPSLNSEDFWVEGLRSIIERY